MLRYSFTGSKVAESGLIQKIQGETEQIIDLVRQLVQRESPSHRKDLVDEVGSLIVELLRSSGLTPQVVPRKEVGDLIWAEWGEGESGRILVLCHIDTVWESGSLKRNPFRVEDGRIYGPGIFDMKGGVAATLKVQEYLSRGWISPRKKVRFLYTTDEELTSSHSRELIEDFARESDLVLITEPPLPGGGLKTFRKGVGSYLVKIHGKSAHSGLEPEKGIDAVDELARRIIEIRSFSAPEKGTTVAVTRVRGGTAINVIAEYAEAGVDTRFITQEEGERVDGRLRDLKPDLPGARLEVEGGIDRSPMVKTQRSEEMFQLAQGIAAELGFNLAEGGSGGGSDGNITAALGVPTLDGLGIPGDGAHAWHEHIEVDELAPRIALLARLIECL
ncbi:M20 family metallopeptidase [Acidobacteria bacterium AH-259-D05]|nr:M20 family metallopeptidase [Acidobacteria bacterium AH-259-D05]